MTHQRSCDHVVQQFAVSGQYLGAKPFGTGHINDTYCATFLEGTGPLRYIVQRVNQRVFRNSAAVMQNIERVTSHIASKVSTLPQPGRRVLSLIPTREGSSWYVDEQGSCWRTYSFLENTTSLDTAQTTRQAYEAASAFGTFQRLLVDLPQPRLHDTIPHFHDTPLRFRSFEKALSDDVAGRARMAHAEIDFCFAHKALASVLLDGGLPERVTHNDTKLSNVLLDNQTGEGICVIDLDTVMPGLPLHDFGDMVRTMTSPALEDEPDLSKVFMQFEMFEAILQGYLDTAGSFLTDGEWQLLVASTQLIAFEQSLRFLTDYLTDDPYYKVHRDQHNLDRCRTQLQLLRSIQQQEKAMERLVQDLRNR